VPPVIVAPGPLVGNSSLPFLVSSVRARVAHPLQSGSGRCRPTTPPRHRVMTLMSSSTAWHCPYTSPSTLHHPPPLKGAGHRRPKFFLLAPLFSSQGARREHHPLSPLAAAWRLCWPVLHLRRAPFERAPPITAAPLSPPFFLKTAHTAPHLHPLYLSSTSGDRSTATNVTASALPL
jgi:hypothetical protein